MSEGFDLDPIEGLRETLLPEFVEKIVERKEVDNNNEESFECLEQSTYEDYEFREKLIKLFPNKDYLVKLCQ